MDIQNNAIVIDADTEALDSQITQISNDFAETYYLDNEQQEELEMLVAKAMKLGELYERQKWQAKAQAVPGWVSVEDKLPIDGQDVIAFDAIKHCVFKGGEFLQGYIESDTGHEYEEPVEVTHWMAVEAQEPAND